MLSDDRANDGPYRVDRIRREPLEGEYATYDEAVAACRELSEANPGIAFGVAHVTTPAG
jgi:hypothetical protein